MKIPRRGLLGLIFARYVPLASQSPYPVIVYSVAGAHGSCLWPIIDPILVTFGKHVIFAILTKALSVHVSTLS